MPIGWAKPRTAPPSTRMVNGATKEPRLNTLVQLCIALEANPSELLEPAGVWSPERLGCASPDDVRLRGAFGQARASSCREAGKRWAAPLVAALATAWTPRLREVAGERRADEKERVQDGKKGAAAGA